MYVVSELTEMDIFHVVQKICPLNKLRKLRNTPQFICSFLIPGKIVLIHNCEFAMIIMRFARELREYSKCGRNCLEIDTFAQYFEGRHNFQIVRNLKIFSKLH